MNQRTPLFDAHVAAGARMVDFGGWDMPVNYGSQIQEHNTVRTDAGVFDVSHMTVVDVSGADATTYLQKLLANDVARLGFDGKALYSGMLKADGKVIDDLIVYRMDPGYRVVVNASTREKDLAWMQSVAADFAVEVKFRADLAMVAIQGPQAITKVRAIVCENAQAVIDQLKIFQGLPVGSWFIGRTGYTGEDGLEIMLPAEKVTEFWNRLLANGIKPCGLGARDTLRLEAGMNLYGHEMDETISPLIANMGWTVAWEPASRDFIGRAALEAEKAAGVQEKLVGLVFKGKGVLRAGQTIRTAHGNGIITSGTFSPTLKFSIAMARVPAQATQNAEVDIRGQWLPVELVTLPFVKLGQTLYKSL